MRLLSLIVPAFLATLAIAVPVEDHMELQRRWCDGHYVNNPACPHTLYQVRLLSPDIGASEKAQ
jgi:hypothetical protein